MAPKPTPEPTRPKHSTTPGVKAGQLFEKLTKLDVEEAAELADAPTSIAKRYKEKRAKVLDGADADVRALVQRMRGVLEPAAVNERLSAGRAE